MRIKSLMGNNVNYRGELKIILLNTGSEPFQVLPGDRIAQVIVAKLTVPLFAQVTELKESDRGTAGIGSTGYRNG